MPANEAARTSFTLRIGVNELLYQNITAGGAQAVFGFPPQMSNWRGVMTIQAVGIGGTPTTVTGDVEISLGGGVFGKFNKVVNVTAAPSTQSAYTGFNLLLPTAIDMSGCGGDGQVRINITTLTLGPASGINVWISIG